MAGRNAIDGRGALRNVWSKDELKVCPGAFWPADRRGRLSPMPLKNSARGAI